MIIEAIHYPGIVEHISRIVQSRLTIVICVIVSKTAGLDGAACHNSDVARLSLEVPALFYALSRIR